MKPRLHIYRRRLQCNRKIHSAASDPYNAFLFQSSAAGGEKTIAVKDNICSNHGVPTTCASDMLRSLTLKYHAELDYRSPFIATLVTLLRKAGYTILAGANMDEFGMGSTSTNTPIPVINSHKSLEGEDLIAGGSSGGSAVAVAAGITWV